MGVIGFLIVSGALKSAERAESERNSCGLDVVQCPGEAPYMSTGECDDEVCD